MDATMLHTLPRAQIQKLAQREGLKANAKTIDIIEQLVTIFPDGVPPLIEDKKITRKSARLQKPKPIKVEEDAPTVGGTLAEASRRRPTRTGRATSRSREPKRKAEVNEKSGTGQATVGRNGVEGQMAGPSSFPREEHTSESYDQPKAPRALHVELPPIEELQYAVGPEAQIQASGSQQLRGTDDSAPKQAKITGASRKGTRKILRELTAMVRQDEVIDFRVQELYALVDDVEDEMAEVEEGLEELQTKRKMIERDYLPKVERDHRLWDGRHASREEEARKEKAAEPEGSKIRIPLQTIWQSSKDKGKKRMIDDMEERSAESSLNEALAGVARFRPNGPLGAGTVLSPLQNLPTLTTWETLEQPSTLKRARVTRSAQKGRR